MKITLTIDGEKKTFSKPITARASLEAFDLSQKIDTMLEEDPASLYSREHREELIDFTVGFFGEAFTGDQLLDGLEDSFFAAIPKLVSSVVEGVNAAVQEIPIPNEQAPEARRKR